MQFFACCNLTDTECSDHGASVAAEQDRSVKKEDFVDNVFAQSGSGNLSTALDEHMLYASLAKLCKHKLDWYATILGWERDDFDLGWVALLKQMASFRSRLGCGDQGRSS
jgi:hypothetical protein